MVAEFQGDIVGFISAYFLPNKADTLFIWQIAVDKKMRGQNLAGLMLNCLLSRPECQHANTLTASVTPSNQASRRLFEKYCDSIDSEIMESDFLDESDFTDSTHEAEILLSIDLNPISVQERKMRIY